MDQPTDLVGAVQGGGVLDKGKGRVELAQLLFFCSVAAPVADRASRGEEISSRAP